MRGLAPSMKKNARKTNFIHIKGGREHNLKNIELRIPREQLVVITGVSGSGKSSLAFDTLYAEGYRKYMDSLSTRARQLLDQVKRPEVDFIHGLSPVIAIEQRTGGAANPRSTVATVTEIADYARLLWAVQGQALCPIDGGVIERRSLDDCINRIFREPKGARLVILAPALQAKTALLREELPRMRMKGFQRVRIDGVIKSLDDAQLIEPKPGQRKVDIVIDRVLLEPDQRSRMADSLELAFREGKDRAIILAQDGKERPWREFFVSQHLACSSCGLVYEPVTPKFFSYNHPSGACSTCGGIGRTLQFDASLVVPNPELAVKKGAVKPWRIGSRRMIIKRNAILKQLAAQLPFDPTIPWKDLDDGVRRTLLHGAGERLFSFKLTGGNKKPELMPFAGILAELEETRRTTSSDGLKARLMAYQISHRCQDCKGSRLKPESLAVRLKGLHFPGFMAMTIEEAGNFAHCLKKNDRNTGRAHEALSGLRERLHFLHEMGLGYLTLDRQYSSLSGGEAQRARLATQLGMGLTGVAYVLDEPTVGLHPADNHRLLRSLTGLRNRGNAVIVVEHDEETIRAADHLIELGPGAGQKGGEIIYEGSPAEAGKCPRSLIGPYLEGTTEVDKNAPTLSPKNRWLTIRGASCHNLKDIDVDFPVGLLTCVTGVSGSGKSTLVNQILAKTAALKLHRAKIVPGPHRSLNGLDYFTKMILVDQSPIGRSPRSNPATYVKLFDPLRKLFAQCPLAKIRGYKASRFSFNVRGGRCERCKGDGLIKLDMLFLADVYSECPSCRGKRYNRETLEVRFKGYNIAETLEMTVDEACKLFRHQPKIISILSTLQAVGLGYVQLGQPSNTLSGGEAQRIKLSLELSKRSAGGALYLLDEPTTGLHWADIQNLLDLLFRLRDGGHTIIIIEHHLDIIRLADWVIDLGPGGGEAGGRILYAGPPNNLTESKNSLTAQCLRDHKERQKQCS